MITPASSAALIELARIHIRAAVLEQHPPLVLVDDEILSERLGCFVSIHEHASKRLRGCVGRLESDLPLRELVPQLSKSVLRDSRFENYRVEPRDLNDLEVELTLLSPLRNVDGPLDFDLSNDGIVLDVGEAGGCFLPQVARETGWSKEQLLTRLCTEKLGMPQDVWKLPNAVLRKFTVEIVGPARV
jgi:uncharacterized protein